jgi:sortase A
VDGARRHRWWWWAGLALVVAGVSVLGWVAWQVEGTNWVSKREQSQVLDRIRGAWDRGEPTSRLRVGGGLVGGLGGEEARVTAVGVVRIPRFGGSYAVPLLEGTSDAVLAAGFGHFTGSAGPGERGNFALAAHRVTHGEPLRDMPSLQPGDRVLVETREATYTYELATGGDDLVVPFTQSWVVDPLPTNPRPGGVQPPQRLGGRLITLTTCSELFHTDDRMVAFGVLVDTRRR